MKVCCLRVRLTCVSDFIHLKLSHLQRRHEEMADGLRDRLEYILSQALFVESNAQAITITVMKEVSGMQHDAVPGDTLVTERHLQHLDWGMYLSDLMRPYEQFMFKEHLRLTMGYLPVHCIKTFGRHWSQILDGRSRRRRPIPNHRSSWRLAATKTISSLGSN